MKMMRLFIGIFPPPEVQAHLSGHLEKVRDEDRLKWAPEASRHVTLQFLGSVPEENISKYQGVLMSLAERQKSFTLFCQGAGVFPSKGKPRVFWAGLGGDTGSLLQLADQVREACRTLGTPIEERPFSPHLTLARMQPDRRKIEAVLEHFKDYRSPDFVVHEIALVESKSDAMGPKYQILTSYKLK
jgi:RNA 2',3'-cyclic 3'-phosphodiesterase